MVDGRFFMVARLIVNDTQIDVGEELSGNVSDLLVTCVIIYRIAVEGRICLTELHVINTDTIVGQGFSVNITDGFAYLKELFVGLDCDLELS